MTDFIINTYSIVLTLRRSTLYTSIFKPVIPAWMPDKSAGSGFALTPDGVQGRIALHEPSHRDVKLRRHPALRIDVRGSEKLPSMALDTGIHAGMTTLGKGAHPHD